MGKALHLYDIIRRPVITEKTDRLADELNQYVFEVHPRANKAMVKKAVEEIFGVDVLRVRIINMPAKISRRWRRPYVRVKAWKKAIVTVAPDQKIELAHP